MIFPTSTTVYRILFEKAQAYISKRYPIIITETYFLTLGRLPFFFHQNYMQKINHFKNILEKLEL